MLNYIAAVSWIINNDCNLKCKHCYPDSGEKFRNTKVLSREEIKHMKKDVEQQDSLIPNLQTCNAISKSDKNGLKRYWGCSAGIEWIGIDHEGNVSPCPLLGYAGLTIGNIKEKN